MNPSPAGTILFCSQCGQPKSEQELAHFGNMLVCSACKPAFVQGMAEGVPAVTGFQYGGFWIRVAAAIIDALIVGFASAAVQAILFASGVPALRQGSTGPAIAIIALAYVVGIAISVSYEGLFVNKVGATPGKMVVGVRVVRPDGGNVALGRAIARPFAKMLSALILGIGYLMVAFDKEKRGLHDMIVETRVVKKRA